MAIASALGLLKGFVFAKVLGVDQLGAYGLVVLVTQFGVYVATWGVLSALGNQLPIALGRQDRNVDELTDRALGAVVLAWAVTAAIYLGFVLFVDPSDSDVTLALVAAAGVTAATTLSEFFFLLLRVERRLVPLASMYLLRAGAAIALGGAAGSIWGFPGVVVSEIVALTAAVAVARRFWLRRVRIRRPAIRTTWWLVRRGAPLSFANVLIAGTFAIDRIFVAATLPAAFGQYTFASFVVLAWVAVIGMLNQVVAPQLLYEYGGGAGLRQIQSRALRTVGLGALVGVAGLLVLIPLTAWLESGILSEFGPGLDAMPILYLGGLISMLALPGFLLHALRPELSTLAAALGALVGLVGGVVLSAAQPGIEDFAWLFVATQLITTMTMLLGVEWLVRRPSVSAHHLPT
jgi:O-antigen/teichoic acid export membrane protein